MYRFLIVGHGKFPSGVLSAINFLMGKNKNIFIIELDENMTHSQYEVKVKEFLRKYSKVLIFADLTGGAPHQIAAKVLLENQFSKEQFIISGMPISTITDIILKFQFGEVPYNEALSTIESSIDQGRDMIQCISAEVV